ncbi:phage tail tube protein [Alicyclobacillus sp. ALC3]|uniref:phage tail tube protein n=1 Tax=Alicyclobacillus sp. ALC3 TaxID=2796143 RepID=UPI002378411B|nr:phage tail tube protein [Alicyclobacillus sp. ALC3]WDL97796.1 hypothetical protein JC200_03435 [Alicyclobacillus sp. ALC3]
MLLSSQSILGYGAESSWGEGAPASLWLPVTSLTATDEVKYQSISNTTSITSTLLNTPIYSGGKVTCAHFATVPTVLDELRAMFGTESVNGNVHTFGMADVPTSYSLTEFDGNTARLYTGGRLQQWTLNWDVNGGLTCQSQWWSKMSQTTSWSGASVPIEPTPAAYDGAISVGGVRVAGVETGTWKFTRVMKLLHSDNIQDVIGIQPGPVVVECTLNLAIEDEGLWTDMQNGTSDSITTTFDWLSITMYSGSWEQVAMDRSGALLKQTAKLRGFYDAASEAVVSATVTE